MKYALTYPNPDGTKTRLVLTEKDLREWLDGWQDYALPVTIKIDRIS